MLREVGTLIWCENPWPPIVTGLISDILGDSAVGET